MTFTIQNQGIPADFFDLPFDMCGTFHSSQIDQKGTTETIVFQSSSAYNLSKKKHTSITLYRSRNPFPLAKLQ